MYILHATFDSHPTPTITPSFCIGIFCPPLYVCYSLEFHNVLMHFLCLGYKKAAGILIIIQQMKEKCTALFAEDESSYPAIHVINGEEFDIRKKQRLDCLCIRAYRGNCNDVCCILYI